MQLTARSDAGLSECNKVQNKERDLVASVKKLQHSGMEVQGGFIVGFDSDPLSIFKDQISFIQKSGIVTTMVGLLNAPRGTQLYRRLQKENRLLKDATGDNTDTSINFVPKMEYETLIRGYKNVVKTIYSPNQYYQRIKTFLKEYQPQKKGASRVQPRHIWPFVKSMWLLGIKENGRLYYWEFLISTIMKHSESFVLCMNLAVYGFHFRKVAAK